MSSTPKSLIEALTETGETEMPWPSEFQLELRARITDVESHLLRVDRLLMEVQGDARRTARKEAEQLARIEAKLDSVAIVLRTNGSNGHG